ncbi:MAG TPA: DinB family protein [Chloroflexia bacterium]|nr:DinB family protein [Chloroflexia bacterium]
MPNTALAEMYRHNLWATMRLLDACEKLTDEQLDATIPGTFGSIRSTLLHWLRNEDRYVSFLRGEQPNPRLAVEPFPGFDALRASADLSGSALVEIAENLPDDPILRTRSDEGEAVELPIMTLIVQALNHATEHRTHIGSLMGAQGVEPPDSDGWAYGDEVLGPRLGLSSA